MVDQFSLEPLVKEIVFSPLYILAPFFKKDAHNKILFDPHPRIMEIKTKINKWNLIKIESFCTTKETISKVKRQLSEWRK